MVFTLTERWCQKIDVHCESVIGFVSATVCSISKVLYPCAPKAFSVMFPNPTYLHQVQNRTTTTRTMSHGIPKHTETFSIGRPFSWRCSHIKVLSERVMGAAAGLCTVVHAGGG